MVGAIRGRLRERVVDQRSRSSGTLTEATAPAPRNVHKIQSCPPQPPTIHAPACHGRGVRVWRQARRVRACPRPPRTTAEIRPMSPCSRMSSVPSSFGVKVIRSMWLRMTSAGSGLQHRVGERLLERRQVARSSSATHSGPAAIDRLIRRPRRCPARPGRIRGAAGACRDPMTRVLHRLKLLCSVALDDGSTPSPSRSWRRRSRCRGGRLSRSCGTAE